MANEEAAAPTTAISDPSPTQNVPSTPSTTTASNLLESAKKRRKHVLSLDKDVAMQRKAIDAALRFFPWSQEYGTKTHAWQQVVEEIGPGPDGDLLRIEHIRMKLEHWISRFHKERLG
jgi:hypothetical protein